MSSGKVVLHTAGGDIGKDGIAHCRICGAVYWRIPPALYVGWVRSGYQPMSQTFHHAAYLTHHARYHEDQDAAD